MKKVQVSESQNIVGGACYYSYRTETTPGTPANGETPAVPGTSTCLLHRTCFDKYNNMYINDDTTQDGECP